MRPCPGADWGVADDCYRWMMGLVWFGGQSTQSASQSTPYRSGQLAGRDWIGAGRAGLGLGLGLGLMDAAQGGGARNQTDRAACLLAAREPRTATTLSGQHAQVGQVGRWAGGHWAGSPCCNGR